jgi:hypothetical protein
MFLLWTVKDIKTNILVHVAQTQQTVPKWLICNELQNKHPPHSGKAAQSCTKYMLSAVQQSIINNF